MTRVTPFKHTVPCGRAVPGAPTTITCPMSVLFTRFTSSSVFQLSTFVGRSSSRAGNVSPTTRRVPSRSPVNVSSRSVRPAPLSSASVRRSRSASSGGSRSRKSSSTTPAADEPDMGKIEEHTPRFSAHTTKSKKQEKLSRLMKLCSDQASDYVRQEALASNPKAADTKQASD